MRYKVKRYRTVHKACKTCAFKVGMKCCFLGFDNKFQENPNDCNYHSGRFISDEDIEFMRHRQNNWKKFHKEQAREELRQRLRLDIEFISKWCIKSE